MCLLSYRDSRQLSRFPKLIELELCYVDLILLYTPVHNSSVTLFYIRRVSHVLQCHASKAHGTSSFGHIFTGCDVREGKVGDSWPRHAYMELKPGYLGNFYHSAYHRICQKYLALVKTE